MIKTFTTPDLKLNDHSALVNEEDFLHQDEQEFLQSIQFDLNQLIREPSEIIIQNILTYAGLRENI